VVLSEMNFKYLKRRAMRRLNSH